MFVGDPPSTSTDKILLKYVMKASIFFCQKNTQSGMVAHAYNPSTLGGRLRQADCLSSEFETSLGNTVKPCLYYNTKDISWVWQHAPVVPATWEAEAGELLEPGELEVAESWDYAFALQPEWQSEIPLLK